MSKLVGNANLRRILICFSGVYSLILQRQLDCRDFNSEISLVHLARLQAFSFFFFSQSWDSITSLIPFSCYESRM